MRGCSNLAWPWDSILLLVGFWTITLTLEIFRSKIQVSAISNNTSSTRMLFERIVFGYSKLFIVKNLPSYYLIDYDVTHMMNLKNVFQLPTLFLSVRPSSGSEHVKIAAPEQEHQLSCIFWYYWLHILSSHNCLCHTWLEHLDLGY
jgi:hypothetical protein